MGSLGAGTSASRRPAAARAPSARAAGHRPRRHEPARQGAAAAGAGRDRAARAPAARGQRARSRRPTARRRRPRWRPSILERAGIATVHNVAGANMAGGVASALLRAPRRRAGSACSRSTSSGSSDVAAALRAARDRARQPVPRPARPLRRARDDRRPLGGARGDAARRALVLNADDPLIADLGRDRAGTLYFGIEDAARGERRRLAHASDSTHCRRCGARVRATRTSTSPTSATTRARAAAAARPAPAVSAHDDRARRAARRELRAAHAGGDGRRAHRAARASTTSTTRSPRRRWRARSGIDAATIAAGLAGAAAVFGRGERVAIGERELSILLVKNPAGANEVLRLLGVAGRRRTTCSASSTTSIADGRDVSWIWDADFETLAPRVAPRSPAPARAPPRSRCGSSTRASPAERIERRRASSATRSTARSRAADGRRSTRCRPTRRCWRCASCCARRGQVASSWARGMSAEAVIWHDLECGGYRADLPLLARARARATAARCSTSAPAPAASRSRSRAPATRVIALERDAELAAELERRARGCAVEVLCADACAFALARPLALAIVPMQTIHLLERPRRVPALRPRGAGARRAAGAWRCSARASSRSSSSCDAGRGAARRRPLRERADGAAARRPAAPSCSSAAARAFAPAARPRSELDRVRCGRCDAATLARRGARPPASRSRRDSDRRRPASTPAARSCCLEAWRVILRVCALYPELMNIYADRGNLLMLERRCAWRGIELAAARERARRRAARRARPLLHRRRPGRRPAPLRRATSSSTRRRRCAPRPRAARSCSGVCGGYQLLGHSYELDGETIPGIGLLDLRTVRASGPRLIGNIAVRSRRGRDRGFENHAGRTRPRPGPGAARARPARPWQRRPQRRRGSAPRQRDRDLRPRAAAAEELVAVRLADGARARRRARATLAPLEDSLERAAHAGALAAA